ncbi:MAG TPA: enoyl-CoA hydratase/isomerase family protein [Solirubrobacteraceae bacterium]|jgi:thioesterase DpgC|nr:enoyl-CoA hydratase/isomerase family protein [Solirubrobacteraceae bacterium]
MALAQLGLQETLAAAGLTAEGLYDELTEGGTRSVRLDELLYLAAHRVPGLVPTRAEMELEAALPLPSKTGIELSQGMLISKWLSDPEIGLHLLGAMLEPTRLALDSLEQYRDAGSIDFGPVQITRRGRAAIVELSNPRHLNAEDRTTLEFTEAAIDLVNLDPEVDVGVFRGGAVEHERYRGERVFGSGINLTHLYHGLIDYLFYVERDLGYVNKLYRGTNGPLGEHEKLWIAVVERFAIGGACQLLHTMDHVIGTRGARLMLPARREGIIPGASNLRLPRFVGDRAARQAILSGREWTVGDPDAELICDETVEPDQVEAALDARIEALGSSGLLNGVANRRVIRAGQEPLDLFRQYMAEYAREQALCHLSPALVRNLEVNWDAANRAL